MDVVAVDADGRARAACGLAPIQVGVLACTRLVEAEDDVLLDVVLPATHRLARQLGAKVVAAAQGPWPDHLPFSPGTYKAPKGSTSLTLDDLDAEESDEEESSDESEAEAFPSDRRRARCPRNRNRSMASHWLPSTRSKEVAIAAKGARCCRARAPSRRPGTR